MRRLRASTLERVDEAVALDFEQIGELGSGSGFVREAGSAAGDAARRRATELTASKAMLRGQSLDKRTHWGLRR